ncbi:MAG: DUF4411 family protein [Thermodesulfobacteriota bacterium]
MDKEYCIDTSSLISLAKYFSPFDDKRIVSDFFQSHFKNKNFVLLDQVLEESKWFSKGLVLETYPFLRDENIVPREKNIVANQRHHNKLDENWSVSVQKRKLAEELFEQQKQEYTQKADFQIIAFCMEFPNSRVAVSEETKSANDGKAFKKIPSICEQENIQHINLSDLLKKFGFSPTYKF